MSNPNPKEVLQEQPVVARLDEIASILRGIAETVAKTAGAGRETFALAPPPADEAYPVSPCRRNDSHDAHTYEVYCRPFHCPGHPRPQPDEGELYASAEAQRDEARTERDTAIKAFNAVTIQLEDAKDERDGAYRERAQLLAWLAGVYLDNVVITTAPDIEEPGWQLLFFTIGARQLSWHISPRDADLFTHVQHVEPDDPRAQWDGHTTEQKYGYVQWLANPYSDEADA